MEEGVAVGVPVLGDVVGSRFGVNVVGALVVGARVGELVGVKVGANVGLDVTTGATVGAAVGGDVDGDTVGAKVCDSLDGIDVDVVVGVVEGDDELAACKERSIMIEASSFVGVVVATAAAIKAPPARTIQ